MGDRSKLLALCLSFVLVLVITTSSIAAPQKVKLVYWTQWQQNPIFNAYLAEVGKEFAKMNPLCDGVEVVTIPYAGYEAKYLSAFMAKTGAPDFFVGMTHEWAGAHQFAEEMPADLAKSVEDSVPPDVKPVGKNGGVRYGIPVEGGNYNLLYINTEMMVEAGLDPNKGPATMEEFFQYAKKMTKYDASGKVIRAGFGMRYGGHPIGITDKFLPFLHAWGGVFVDPTYKKAKGYVDSEVGIEALTFYGDLVNKHKVSSLEIGIPENAFAQKMAAMLHRATWLSGWLKTNGPDIKFRAFPLPAMKVAPGPSELFPWAEMVYKYSPNKKLVWDFLRFVWTKEHDFERHKRQGLVPVMTVNLDTPYVKTRPDYPAFMEMNKRKPGPVYFHPKCNEVATTYGDAVLDVVYARKDPRKALTEAAAKIERIIQ